MEKKKIWLLLVIFLFITSIAQIVDAQTSKEKAMESVVRVYAQSETGGWTGTAFAVGKAGESTDIFVTNGHVVTDANVIVLLLGNEAILADGSINEELCVKCSVLYYSTYPDIAILQAERVITERKSVPLLRTEKNKKGDEVYAIGYPGSQDSINQSQDVVIVADVEQSAISSGSIMRFTTYTSADNTMVIQHSAQINHGNSGGPLVNQEGAVIGINTYGLNYEDSSGNQLEIPEYYISVYIDYAMDILDELGISYSVYKENYLKYLIPAAGVLLVLIFIIWVIRSIKSKEDHTVKLMRLQGISGYYAGKRFPLDREVKFGRDPSCNNLVFPKDINGVSGVHCKLFLDKGHIYLMDLRSSYGTFLNGQRIQPDQAVRIQEGDMFYLARTEQAFRIETTVVEKKKQKKNEGRR